jgi:hypothetical protein
MHPTRLRMIQGGTCRRFCFVWRERERGCRKQDVTIHSTCTPPRGSKAKAGACRGGAQAPWRSALDVTSPRRTARTGRLGAETRYGRGIPLSRHFLLRGARRCNYAATTETTGRGARREGTAGGRDLRMPWFARGSWKKCGPLPLER